MGRASCRDTCAWCRGLHHGRYFAGGGRPVGPVWHDVQPVALVGLPLATGLLWAVRRLDALQRRIDQIGKTDPLTGLYNRRTFLDRTLRALPQSGMLLMLDIDHFKAVNLCRGHQIGDLCLMALAQRFRELTCDTDILGRLDGAVFAIYLPGAPVELGRDIGDRLSEGLSIVADCRLLQATISVGAVVADGRTPLRDADIMLERAKLQGRARMILQDTPIAA